ncbi:MAG TPA: RIP metalloprotease RseP, partial [Gammaproteobacteria bacterium]|nr:RIP metalloprotease RseP [Gammaproteobacteria bacterium]
MTAFLYSLIGFVVAIGLLTAIHEYGHFWVARRLGVKVLRFSIGFGKKIYSWHDKSGTEYAICAIPLGGYVKMLDQNEGIVAPSELHRAFNNKPVWIRMLIIAAGPICNMLFAVLAYWLIFVWGVAGVVPILGDVPPSSVAYAAGLRSGQEITAVDNRATTSWEDIVLELMRHSDEHDYIPITTLDTTSKTSATHRLNLQNWSIDNNANDFLSELGLVPLDPLLPIVGSTVAYYPAQQAGLQAGDLIKAINGEPVNSISQLLHTLHDKYGQELNVQISRNGKDLTTQIMPVKKVHENGDVSGFIGVQFAPQKWPDKYIRIHRYSPLVALDMALDRTK